VSGAVFVVLVPAMRLNFIRAFCLILVLPVWGSEVMSWRGMKMCTSASICYVEGGFLLLLLLLGSGDEEGNERGN
jgi:hypothetical protein